jgi:hypothetical protein
MNIARVMALALFAFGTVLRTYMWSFEALWFSTMMWLLALVPYAAGAILLFRFHRPHAAAGAMLLPAFLDAATFYLIFIYISPPESFAVLRLVFVPLWNAFLLAPLGGALGWWIGDHTGVTEK